MPFSCVGLVSSGIPETSGEVERVDGDDDDYDGIRLPLIEARRRAPSALVLPGSIFLASTSYPKPHLIQTSHTTKTNKGEQIYANMSLGSR